MRKVLLLVAFILPCLSSSRDDLKKRAMEILKEGKLLYRLEKSSWIGTDMVVRKGDTANVGGYFSYMDGNDTRCVFYSREDTPQVLESILFDSLISPMKNTVDKIKRPFSKMEQAVFALRKAALKELSASFSSKHPFFERYKNTGTNLIPIIDSNRKVVYIITSPAETGVILFGNDYLLTFDEDYNLTKKEKLHNSLITQRYGDEKTTSEMGWHTHVLQHQKLFTPTDICTILLYQEHTKWKKYMVISRTHTSMWTIDSDELQISK